MPSLRAFKEESPTNTQGDPTGFMPSKYLAALLVLILATTFFQFRSGNFIGDGLRHLPALRTIKEGPTVTFQAKPWLEVYRANYERVSVRYHFLFGLAMRAAFGVQQALGVQDDAILAMQVVNAIAAAIAGGLFFLLVLRLGVPMWVSVVVTLACCLSPVYLLMATNVAEVPLALPFFMGALLTVSGPDFPARSAAVAGLLAALAAITYLLAGSIVPCIVLAVIASKPFTRSTVRSLLLFLSVFAIVFLGIWIGVLLLSGMRSPVDIVAAIFSSPQQGTYGGFKLGSLIAEPIGFTQAMFPILPADFRGLRSLYQHTPILAASISILSLLTCAFLLRAVYLLWRGKSYLSMPILTSLFTFLLVQVACLKFDPYYSKLQIFSLILFWVILAAGFAGQQTGRRNRWLLLTFAAAVVVSGFNVLWDNIQPSQPKANAQGLHAIVQEGVLVTGWSNDVAHLWLYSNGNNIIPLPDFALARNLHPDRVEADLNAIIRNAQDAGTNVYFYGLFDADDEDLKNVYDIRFRLSGFTSYLRRLQKDAKPMGRFPQPGGHSTLLYLYRP